MWWYCYKCTQVQNCYRLGSAAYVIILIFVTLIYDLISKGWCLKMFIPKTIPHSLQK